MEFAAVGLIRQKIVGVFCETPN